MTSENPSLLTNLKGWLDDYADPNWRKAHWMWSLQLIILGAAIQGLYLALPAFQDHVSLNQFVALCMLVSVASVISRLIRQRRIHGDK